ncbi:MAG: hydroxymethylbilane synthase [Candidatus Omnitrophota bacterium]
MPRDKLIIGSRGSRLALAQAEIARGALRAHYPDLAIEIKTITTIGDRLSLAAAWDSSDKGVFVKELEQALLRGGIDIAVHSMKDVPVELPSGLKIVAITARDDAGDALVSLDCFDLTSLPQGVKVGTASPRRQAQLLNRRRDLEVVPLRGNIDTRIKMLRQREFKAIILAVCGIRRLGYDIKFSPLPITEMLPCPGQGALGIEAREGDGKIAEIVSALDDRDTRLAVQAERGLLAGLGGGCRTPIGAYAYIRDGRDLILCGGVFSPDGRQALKDNITAPLAELSDSTEIGRSLAKKIGMPIIQKA